MAILVVADHDRGALLPTTTRAIGALGGLKLPIDVLVAGSAVGAVSEAAAAIAGVRNVIVADRPELANQQADTLTNLLLELAGDYSHIAAVAAAVGRDTIPRLAAKLDVMPVTDVTAIHTANRFERPIYAGNAIETVSTAEPKILLTIRPSAFGPAPAGGTASVRTLMSDVIVSATEFLVAHRTPSDVPDLSTARIVVAGGIALGSTHSFEMIERLANVLGAAVGATRAAVDAGFAPNDWQVGQTGKVIAPDLYIAIGISGALQHLAGIHGAKRILAINSDPDAPLMQIADLAVTGDLFEIVPALTAALEKRLSAK